MITNMSSPFSLPPKRLRYSTSMGRRQKFVLPPLPLDETPIGARIARLRKQHGLSQKELAERIGITHHLVSDYETGRLHLNDQMVARMALALQVSADALLGLNRTRTEDHTPSLRIMKRVQKLEQLPLSQQKAILHTLDLAIEAAQHKRQRSADT